MPNGRSYPIKTRAFPVGLGARNGHIWTFWSTGRFRWQHRRRMRCWRGNPRPRGGRRLRLRVAHPRRLSDCGPWSWQGFRATALPNRHSARAARTSPAEGLPRYRPTSDNGRLSEAIR